MMPVLRFHRPNFLKRNKQPKIQKMKKEKQTLEPIYTDAQPIIEKVSKDVKPVEKQIVITKIIEGKEVKISCPVTIVPHAYNPSISLNPDDCIVQNIPKLKSESPPSPETKNTREEEEEDIEDEEGEDG